MKITENRSSSVKIREILLSDLESMWKLCSNPTLSLIDTRRLSLDEFNELWHHRWNIKDGQDPQHTLGWVLVHPEDGVVGFIGNIPVDWWIENREIKGFAAISWIVDPRFRVLGLGLYQKFFLDQQTFFLLATTANPVAAKVCEMNGALPIPVESLLWEIKSVDYYYRKLTRFYQYIKETGQGDKKISLLIRLLNIFPGFRFTALVYGSYLALRRIGKDGLSHGEDSSSNIEQFSHFGEEFDGLWQKNREKVGSTVVRSSCFLNWRHFLHPKSKGRTYALKYTDNGEVKGYITFREMGVREDILGVYHVTDLFYDFDDHRIADILLSAAFNFSKITLNAVAFEVGGLIPEIMESLKKGFPTVKRTKHYTYWYKCPENENTLLNKKWWLSRIDGDQNL